MRPINYSVSTKYSPSRGTREVTVSNSTRINPLNGNQNAEKTPTKNQNNPAQSTEFTKRNSIRTSTPKVNHASSSIVKEKLQSRAPVPSGSSRPPQVVSSDSKLRSSTNHITPQKKSTLDAYRMETPATSSSDLSTSENSNQVRKQNIIDRKANKRLIEQKLHEQMKKQGSEHKIPTNLNSFHSRNEYEKKSETMPQKPKTPKFSKDHKNHVLSNSIPLRNGEDKPSDYTKIITHASQSQAKIVSKSNICNGDVAPSFHASLSEQLKERKLEIEEKNNRQRSPSPYDDVCESAPQSPQPPPPVGSIEFTNEEISPMFSPIESPVSAMKQLRDAQIKSKLKGLMAPLVTGDDEDAPLIEIESVAKPEPKKVARRTSKIRKDQKRLLEETENEIQRMEARLAELKLIREIQLLEEELKRQGVTPVLSKPPRAPAVKEGTAAYGQGSTIRTTMKERPWIKQPGEKSTSTHQSMVTTSSMHNNSLPNRIPSGPLWAKAPVERSTSTHQSMITTHSFRHNSLPNRVPSQPLGAKEKPLTTKASSAKAKSSSSAWKKSTTKPPTNGLKHP